MPHIDEGIHILHDSDVGLVVGEVVIGLDSSDDLGGLIPLLQLDIDHSAVNTCTCGDGHREGSLDSSDRLDGYRMPHAHTGAEVGVGDPTGHDGLHESTHDRVAPWIPARGDHRDGVVLTGSLPESAT